MDEDDGSGKELVPVNTSEEMTSANTQLEEQMRLQMAHELVMNEGLELNMPQSDTLYGHVKQIVHRAFWDSVREGLRGTPPDFEHSIRLLAEIKGILLELIPAGAPNASKKVEEVLDMDLIKQQIEQEAFNLRGVVEFIVSIMAGLCAPARDSTVSAILTHEDPVDLFKHVFEALDLMRLDFVNYQLRTIRPALLANSVQYEQGKFRAILESNPAALDKTKLWLQSTVVKMRGDNANITPSTLLSAAYLRLLECDVDPVPETIHMDHTRFVLVSRELGAVVFSAATILILQSGVGPALQHDSFANKVRVVIYQLCADELIEHPRDIMANISEKLLDLVKETVTQRQLSDQECDKVRAMVSALAVPTNSVYCLLWARARQYFSNLSGGVVGDCPAGFSVCSTDLQGVASKFTHLVSYNRGVFGPFYADIIPEILASSQQPMIEG